MWLLVSSSKPIPESSETTLLTSETSLIHEVATEVLILQIETLRSSIAIDAKAMMTVISLTTSFWSTACSFVVVT